MTDHLTNDVLNGYRERRLPPAELLAADDHLAACEACRRRLGAGPSQLAASLEAGPVLNAGHLSYEQLAALVDGAGDPAARQHLATCELCTLEFNDLRQYAGELKRQPAPIRRTVRSSWTWGGAAALAASLLLATLLWKPGHPVPAPSPAPAGPIARLSLQEPAGTLSLDAQGKLFGPAAPADPALAADIRRTLDSGRLELSLPRAVETRHSVLLGPAPAAHRFRVQAPLGEAVLSDRPAFTWSAVPGATGYEVQIFDLDYRPIVQSPLLHATTWTPPAPLPRGKLYAWQVTALLPDSRVTAPRTPDPEARFLLLDHHQAAAIESARGANGSHLAAAIALAKAGARTEARKELDELERLNPGSPLLAALRRSLNEAKGE